MRATVTEAGTVRPNMLWTNAEPIRIPDAITVRPLEEDLMEIPISNTQTDVLNTTAYVTVMGVGTVQVRGHVIFVDRTSPQAAIFARLMVIYFRVTPNLI